MKRPIILLLIIVLIFGGCGSAAAVTTETDLTAAETTEAVQTLPASTEMPTTAEPVTEAPTTEAPTTQAPTTEPPETLPEYNEAGKKLIDNRDLKDDRPAYHFEFRPHVFSDIDLRIYGEKARDDFFAFCDAVLAGEDGFPCSGEDSWALITEQQKRLFPLGEFVSIDPEYEGYSQDASQDGQIPITYLISKEEMKQKIEEFRQQVADLIAAADLREGDTDLEKALKLYTMLSLRTQYDYEAMEDETFEISLSAYRTLMTGWGICQEIAPAYAYLLLQVGVEANTCGSLAKDNSFAHEWTMIGLDGVYYHADVTYQLDTPYSLCYFLTSDEQRSGDDLDIRYLNIAGSNRLWHKDLPMEDERYAPLWESTWYRIDHEGRRIWYYTDWDLEGPPAQEKLQAFSF